jgi:hypothetical protein
LKKEFDNINFEAFFVHENGNITRYSWHSGLVVI